MAGFSLEEADIFRRSLRQKTNLLASKKKFFSGCEENGISKQVAEVVFSKFEENRSYWFNRSHGISYSRVAYRGAYLKRNYPLEYLTAFIRQYHEKTAVVQAYVNEAVQDGVAITQPDINLSGVKTEILHGTVHLGFEMIKHCGLGLFNSLIAERMENGSFSNLFDFCERMRERGLTRKALLSLIAEGALNNLPGTPAQKFASAEKALRPGDSTNNNLIDQISSFDLIKEIISIHKRLVKDVSFDVYCPKMYTHHLRFTLWLPPEKILYEMDFPEFIEHSRSLAGILETEKSEDYVIGLNSRVDQYSERHLLMLDLDSIDQALMDELKNYGGYLIKSGSGYHFIGDTIYQNVQDWKDSLLKISEEPVFNSHIDKRHVDLSLRRGYSTLRIVGSPLKPYRPMMIQTLR